MYGVFRKGYDQIEIKFLTPRLLIRPYTIADTDQVWRVVRSPDIYATTAYIPRKYPRSRAEWWIRMVRSSMENRTSFEFGMFERDTGVYVGNIGIINVRKDACLASIAYYVDPEKWGKGYATEAGEAMLKFAFQTLQLYRVAGTGMLHNMASRRVMEKLGFRFEGIARSELYKDGQFIDVAHLAVLKPEWEARMHRKENQK